jgi:putative ABC transport system permease protein
MPLILREGRAPEASDEVVIDAETARSHDLAVGDPVTILFRGPPGEFTVVGVAGFGSADDSTDDLADSLGGAAVTAFELSTAQRVLAAPGMFGRIDVTAGAGVPAAELWSRVAAALPAGYEVATGETLSEEINERLRERFAFLRVLLLVFAGLSLFFGGFIIHNTFAILVAQRRRELALLWAIGASRRQLEWAVLAEAAVIGVAASALGLGAGALAARGIVRLLEALGVAMPSSPLQLLPRTAVLSMLAGVVITCAAALSPARQVSRRPSISALAEGPTTAAEGIRGRALAGAVTLGLGCAAVLLGLSHDGSTLLVALGAAVAFVGVAVFSPALAGPLAVLVGAPLRVLGAPARLGQANAVRHPRRTASTAAALMVALTLVGTVTILATSAQASSLQALRRALTADFVLAVDGFTTFSPELAHRLDQEPAIAAAAGLRSGAWRYQGSTRLLRALPADALGAVVILDMRAGTADALGDGKLLVDELAAREHGWAVGDVVPMEFARTGVREVTVGGVFARNPLVGPYLVSTQLHEANYSDRLDVRVLVRAAADASPAEVDAAMGPVLRDFPSVQSQDQRAFNREQVSRINRLLGLVTALLGLAVGIGLLGIVNALALGVLERTREIGLLRAVGMTRRQVAAMVLCESVVVTVFGAAVGVLSGSAMGWALVSTLADDGITDLVLPLGRLAAFLALAALTGAWAAVLPARRAARLDVLAALAVE